MDDDGDVVQRSRGGVIADMRQDGIALPIHLGIPGAVELGRLTRIAARIGVADAARYLLKQRGLIGYLMQRPSFSAESFPHLALPNVHQRCVERPGTSRVHDESGQKHACVAEMLERLS